MTKSPMTKKMNAHMPKSALFPPHRSIIEDSHFLHRPSTAAASGTYPSSHTAQSGPTACSAHLIRVTLNTLHALGLRHAKTAVSPRSAVGAAVMSRRRLVMPAGRVASYHHPSRSFSTPPEQSMPRGPQLEHDVPPRAAYSPTGHGEHADCASSGTEPAGHSEQLSDPETATSLDVQGSQTYAFAVAFSHLYFPTAHGEHMIAAASRTQPGSHSAHVADL